LQNIPIQSAEGRRIRTAFIPNKGSIFISLDYSQIELRLLAHLSEDENLIASFESGKDIHAQTAREVLGLPPMFDVTPEERRVGKTINFGIVYGMGAFRLGRDLGIPVGQASQYINSYFARYPRVKAYFARLEQEMAEKDVVTTILGRKRFISSIDTSGRDQDFARRAAMNAPLQGSAADVIKLAMIRVDAFLRRSYPEVHMVLQVHDELLIEAPDRGSAANETLAKEIQQEMERVIELKVPLKVDYGIGLNWNEA
jgi:DNA polymerase-1